MYHYSASYMTPTSPRNIDHPYAYDPDLSDETYSPVGYLFQPTSRSDSPPRLVHIPFYPPASEPRRQTDSFNSYMMVSDDLSELASPSTSLDRQHGDQFDSMFNEIDALDSTAGYDGDAMDTTNIDSPAFAMPSTSTGMLAFTRGVASSPALSDGIPMTLLAFGPSSVDPLETIVSISIDEPRRERSRRASRRILRASRPPTQTILRANTYFAPLGGQSIPIELRDDIHFNAHGEIESIQPQADTREICRLCSKRFRHREHLRRHMLSKAHSSVTPFKCPLLLSDLKCDRACNRWDNMIQHVTTHASKVIEPRKGRPMGNPGASLDLIQDCVFKQAKDRAAAEKMLRSVQTCLKSRLEGLGVPEDVRTFALFKFFRAKL